MSRPKALEKKRLNLDLTLETHEVLLRAKQLGDHDSYTETIRKALYLYKKLLDIRSEMGGVLDIKAENRETGDEKAYSLVL